ncbi:phage tape measure protein [Mannheimia haemolytica serotype A2 str. OVINE]|uniref:tape measure protein n=1 Tax=Mannheimia haemolytica TaxID=75985 RepID=UPI0001BCFD38|nr:tape measure protein [Mannheimia haemolytica]EEY09676.1 phage tape measure protein [Mannheimia haemolytica serotype A2 str. OVINE]HDZ6746834.1 tape measure protein [Mannheimia haemolytica]HDZ6811957.1 tape measure protein [Mannheimia haemolytica]
MASLGNLNISLSLETVQFQQGLNKSAYQSQKFSREFQVNLSAAQNKARQFSERTTQYLNNIERAATSINKTANISLFSSIANWAGNNLVSAASQTLKYADSYTELQNRMRLVTDSQNEMVAATNTVFDISLRTNQAVGATSEVYQRFAKNADTLKISQKQVAELTETVSKAVAMSGASSASAEAALMQFGQAMASGELRGAELNSVMEQTPALAQAIADGLGVSVGALKDMGKNGELQISKVIEALQKAKDTVDTDFEKRVKTLSMSFTNLETSMIQFVGQVDSTYGVTQKLAEGVDFVSENLESMIKVAGALIGALAIGHISKYSATLLQTGYNSAKNAIAHTREAQAILAKATAMRTAAQVEMASLAAQLQLAQSEKTRYALREQMKVQAAQIIALAEAEATAKRNLAAANTLASTAARGLQSAMALLGGPAGVIMIAASALMYFSSQADQARQKALDTAGANERLKESYEGLSAAALSLKITQQQEELENYKNQIQQLQSDISALEANWFTTGLPIPDSVKKEIAELSDQIELLKENASIDFSVLENQLEALARAMLSSGKSLDDIRAKFKLLSIDASETEWILAGIPSTLNDIGDSAEKAAGETLNLDDAMKKLQERSVTLAQKLEVAKLEQQGQAESAYVLAGLYELLGVEGAKYNEVLIGIATGTITAANAADKAIGLSQETLKKILDGKAMLQGMFKNETQIQTIKTELRENAKVDKPPGSGENARENWLSFYDDLRKRSGSTLNEINLEETRMFQRLEEHMKKGVVSHTEYETAKTAITQRFAKERLELAGKYAPEKLLSANLKDELSAIQELRKAGHLTESEYQIAEQQLKFDYAQNKSQRAISPIDQVRGMYDSEQDLKNQQARELAQLQAFYDQKLMTEEEFQKRKQQIISRYENERWQKEMSEYATGLNDLGGAFDVLTSTVEQSAGKQSAAYKAMFAVSKAFAIAEASVRLSQAIAQAMADTTALTPAQKFANMAAVAAAGANVISQITSVAFAKGGHVQGPGTGTSDSILARLSNNEFVMTSRTVDHYGVGFLNALNQRRLPKFANGGHVGGKSGNYDGLFNSNNAQSNEVSITINIDSNGNEEVTMEQKAAQGKELAMAIQANVLEVLKKQRRPGGLLS